MQFFPPLSSLGGGGGGEAGVVTAGPGTEGGCGGVVSAGYFIYGGRLSLGTLIILSIKKKSLIKIQSESKKPITWNLLYLRKRKLNKT